MVARLKRLRQKRGVSQQALAEAVGVSQQSINKYENHGVEPDIQTLIRLAEFFNTSVDYLVGHTEIDHIIEPVQSYDLNAEEAEFLQLWRRLLPREQESLRLVAENYLLRR